MKSHDIWRMECSIGKRETYLESTFQDLQNCTHFNSFLKSRMNSSLREP